MGRWIIILARRMGIGVVLCNEDLGRVVSYGVEERMGVSTFAPVLGRCK